MDLKLIEQGMLQVLVGLGVDLTDPNFKTTPQRAARVFQEVFQPPETEWPVFDEDYTDMVVMRGHVFYTFCPHHLLPVKLQVSVAYLPNGKVIGASKLIRMIHDANRLPMTQEKLTSAILDSIDLLTGGTSAGSAVWMVGEHGCFNIRGVRSAANMVTLKFRGHFDTEPELQRRFMAMVENGR